MPTDWAEQNITRARVVERYNLDRPAGGAVFSAWVKQVAEEFNFPARDVRAAIMEYTNGYLHDVRTQSLTHAQRVAETMGATVMEAMDRLKEGMHAVKTRRIVVGKGEDARVEEFSDPDWPVIIAASTKVLDVHGSWAPKQVEVHSRNENFNYSDADLRVQFDELMKQIATQFPSTPGANAQVATGTIDCHRIEEAASPQGLLLLDDGSHADGGRAEREPVPSVPEGTLHPKSRRRPAKRASPPARKK